MGDRSIEKDKILNYLTKQNAEKEIECEWLRDIIIRLIDEIEDGRLQVQLIRQVNEELVLLIQTHIDADFNSKDLTKFKN
ncbi:hypothetical protein I5515_04745 [Acinetobacter calcoaceticus]|uniref:hypothetical protein n=1 Tax=Acinetobacter calcoaceticus TaxID=471 RepID=UPI001902B8BF|nr:hypothetical protein [Acinetobacter calcoaceticus]MBJ9721102.1 hypothetical protein [Acinetobacter calcoaceticus]